MCFESCLGAVFSFYQIKKLLPKISHGWKVKLKALLGTRFWAKFSSLHQKVSFNIKFIHPRNSQESKNLFPRKWIIFNENVWKNLKTNQNDQLWFFGLHSSGSQNWIRLLRPNFVQSNFVFLFCAVLYFWNLKRNCSCKFETNLYLDKLSACQWKQK